MEPDIAPLAQRLAEENNVDWRQLEGTGENGRIVERDVLDYLARVMAGEAAVDPTPEPLPEGMHAWTDDEGNPIEATPGPAVAEGDRTDGEVQERPTDVLEEADEDLLLAGDDLLTGSSGGSRTGVGSEDEPRVSEERDRGASVGAPDLFASDESDGDGAEDGPPDLFEADVDADVLHDDATSSSDFDFGGLPGAEPDRDEPVADLEGALGSDEDATVSFDLGGDAAVEDETPSEAAFAFDDEAAASEVDAVRTEPQREAPVESPVETPVAASSDEQGAPETWPLARVRTVVRRHVDLGGMLALQRSAGLESGRETVPASAVLLLAARRAAARLDVEAPGVALPGGAAGVRVVVPSAATLGGVASEIDEVERGAPAANDRADLWIADLSGLGIDEAILDTEHPQLTLGRVLTDDEHGSLQGTLTLAGDHELDRAAAFLARVADLVEDPLRLLA